MTIDNVTKITTIDNGAKMPENNYIENQAGETTTSTSVAGASVPEDTAQGWQTIIDTKDSIIAAYESQVSRLQEQISNLIRSGGVVASENAENEPKPQQHDVFAQSLGGFASGVKFDGSFADLGKEIGK